LDENGEQLRQGYEAFARGDVEAALEFFAEDIRWQGPSTDGLPDSGMFHGRAEVGWMLRQLLRAFGEELRIRPDEFVEDGRTVVVLGHLEATPEDADLHVPWAHIWRFEERRPAAHVMTLTDTALMRESLGN
jgi:ketosteroid isomerase-like protein